MSIELVMLSNHLKLCLTLLQPSVFPNIRIFPNESALPFRWPKYWSFSFGISLCNEFSGLISFRIGWFDLAVQGTLKSLLQHRSLKASVLQCSAFFIVQFLHCTFVSKVMSLLFSKVSSFVIVFLPRSKHLLLSGLQSLSAVILEPKKIKSVTVSTFSSSVCHDGTRYHDLSFLNVEF